MLNCFIGIKKHVNILVGALPNFLNVGIFLIFVFILFAILGLHQYGESFLNRCRIGDINNTTTWQLTDDLTPCTANGQGKHKCNYDLGEFCANPYNYSLSIDSDGDDVRNNYQIFYGIATFNDIAGALILINQFVSTDSWSTMMYNMMDVDNQAFAIIYSLTMVIIGNFFIMNLILAVIFDTFLNL